MEATDASNGFDFGRVAAIDGWTLESARCLGALSGFDPDEVAEGYLDQRQRPRGRTA